MVTVQRPLEEVQALEQETGLRVAVSSGDLASRRVVMHRVQVILIELPMAASVIQETLSRGPELANVHYL